jgi:hypothetical protein
MNRPQNKVAEWPDPQGTAKENAVHGAKGAYIAFLEGQVERFED